VSIIDAVVTCRNKVIAALLSVVHATVNGWVVFVITNVD